MNKLLIENFNLLLKQRELEYFINKDPKYKFRIKSIKNVIKIIKKINNKINITNIKDVENIKGIGKKSLKRIEEILKNNKLKEIYIKKKDILQIYKSIKNLTKVIGINKKAAYYIYKKYNIKTLEELIDNKNVYNSLKNISKTYLKYHKHLSIKLNKDIIYEIEKFLNNSLDINSIGLVCGSFRRGELYSGDIDYLFTNINDNKINLENFIKVLYDKKFLIDNLTKLGTRTKFMGVFSYKNTIGKIDIRYTPYNSYYFTMIHLTGNKEFNIFIRKRAKKMGFHLNEYGIYKNNKLVLNPKSELDIFEFLKIKYLKPNER